MKRVLVVLATILALSGCIGAYLSIRTSNAPISVTYTAWLDTKNIHYLVNAERTNVGLNQLERDTRLDASACEKMSTITASEYIRHDGYNSIIAKHLPEWKTMGENLSFTNQSEADVVRGWMASEGHRVNILGTSYTRVGYCVGRLPFEYLGKHDVQQVVQHFAN